MSLRPDRMIRLLAFRAVAALAGLFCAIEAVWRALHPDIFAMRCLSGGEPTLLHCSWCYAAVAFLALSATPTRLLAPIRA